MPDSFIRPHENAYDEAPFFHLPTRSSTLRAALLAASCLIWAGSLIFYGYGVLVHTGMVFLGAGLVLPLIRIFQKNTVFYSTIWITDLLLISAALPVSLPWQSGLAGSLIYFFAGRLLLTSEGKHLFSPIALALAAVLHIFPPPFFHGATVFHGGSGPLQWVEASGRLFLGSAQPSQPSLLLGGMPGGSVCVVLGAALFLSFFRAANFSITLIYLGGRSLGLFSGILGIPLLSEEGFVYVLESLFAGLFLLNEPMPLEYPKKAFHALAAAAFGVFFTGGSGLYLGILAANTLIPLLDILPRKRVFGLEPPPPHPPAERPRLLPALQTAGAGLALALGSLFLGSRP